MRRTLLSERNVTTLSPSPSLSLSLSLSPSPLAPSLSIYLSLSLSLSLFLLCTHLLSITLSLPFFLFFPTLSLSLPPCCTFYLIHRHSHSLPQTRSTESEQVHAIARRLFKKAVTVNKFHSASWVAWAKHEQRAGNLGKCLMIREEKFWKHALRNRLIKSGIHRGTGGRLR